ncbi:MAG: endopeptidase La [Anaerolineae bacterium]|nr:endopeptidase La [Anaerolineae bacterium]MDK1117186.1 endopeptidase La [Anaerolineae bacterium]
MNLLLSPFSSVLKENGDETLLEEKPLKDDKVNYPDVLPILPLRGVVVYPQTVVPLTVGQARSIKLVDEAVGSDKFVGLVAATNPELGTPGPTDLYRVGTIATIHKLLRAPDNTIRLLVQGLDRFKLGEFVQEKPYLKAEISLYPEKVDAGLELDALARNARDQFEKIAQLLPSMPEELISAVLSLEDPLQTVYSISNFQRIDLADAQQLLEINSVIKKLRKLVSMLVRELEVLTLGQKIQNEAREEIDKVQREFFLHEQMKAIQRELGENDEQVVEAEEFRIKIDDAKMTEEAEKQARLELDRLVRLPTAAAEYGVIRTYLDWLVSLPWSKTTDDNLDIEHARKILDKDHYGLKEVKQRILEFLAIRKLRMERKDERKNYPKDTIRQEREGVILCFVGPPGVGKTSLGRSIARAMNRKFTRISLGGMRDEAEIRGHRRTYIGALPGRILQALRRIESQNPVFMLDEIDKLVFDFHGDPASALLEVLDSEQNREFRDHYLEVSYDLSQIFFITTANSLESIPGPLRDRMDITFLSGYTDKEKISIAKGYLIPRQIIENGLRKKEIKFTNAALQKIIRGYTREAGVRNLERKIGAICRKVGTRIAEGVNQNFIITPQEVEEYLEHPIYHGSEEISIRTSIHGVVPGLAWTPYGGEVLFIESTRMTGGKGFQVTGSIGNVMKESAQAAFSYVRTRTKELGLDDDYFSNLDIHMHIPAGATPKDGPSAGVAMATSLVSLVTKRKIKRNLGMTGEITLRGHVLPVGGIKEKVLAAHRNGLKVVILPKQNEFDLDDVPEEIKNKIKFILVETVDEVLSAALEKKRTRAAVSNNRSSRSPKKQQPND